MQRETWSSKLGVVLAVAGSAVGLGNFLRFPGLVAQNGGGAFIIPYLISFLILGLPLAWVEWTLGRHGGQYGHATGPGSFQATHPKKKYLKYLGILAVVGPTIVFIYYTYIESWLLGFGLFALSGKYETCQTKECMSAFLNGYRGVASNEHFSGIGAAYAFFLITFFANFLVLYHGLRGGIEKLCKWALPLLLVIAMLLLARVFTLGTPDPTQPENNVINGMGFIWNPDWSALLTGKVWLAAAGQIFFTLSLGLGAILAYSSYMKEKDDLALSSLTASTANEFAEVILGGSIVIPAAFAFFGAAATAEFAKGGTFDLGFLAMPMVLKSLPFAKGLGFLWFFLLFLAGITSSVSLGLPAIAFLEDELKFSRKKAVIIFGLFTFIACHAVIFGLEHGVVDEMDFWGGTVFIVLVGLIEALLFGWVLGLDKGWQELHNGASIQVPTAFRFVIKYVTPAFLFVILGVWAYQEWLSILLMTNVAPANTAYVLGTRAGILALIALFIWMVKRASKNWSFTQKGESS